MLLVASGAKGDDTAVALPPGVIAEWDLAKAYHQTTPTRERICLNGLWRWQPAGELDAVPAEDWGYFKVPGSWPGINDWMQKDSQTLYVHPKWRGVDPAGVKSAWYQREIVVPEAWSGRRMTLQTGLPQLPGHRLCRWRQRSANCASPAENST